MNLHAERIWARACHVSYAHLRVWLIGHVAKDGWRRACRVDQVGRRPGPTSALNELLIGWRKCCGAHVSGWWETLESALLARLTCVETHPLGARCGWRRADARVKEAGWRGCWRGARLCVWIGPRGHGNPGLAEMALGFGLLCSFWYFWPNFFWFQA